MLLRWSERYFRMYTFFCLFVLRCGLATVSVGLTGRIFLGCLVACGVILVSSLVS